MTSSSQKSDYVYRGIDGMDRYMRERRADVEAGFLMPYLEPSMSLIDVGCGQGTITLGLAEILTDGSVAGFDRQEEHVAFARELARSQGTANADFRVGDVFAPPFAAEAFDVAYSNAVLSHLGQPDEALQAIISLVKPGGLIALRDRGSDPVATGPYEEPFMRAAHIRMAVTEATVRNPYGSQAIGLVLNRLCRQAGLHPLAVSASWQILSSSSFGEYSGVAAPHLADRAVDLGITTRDELASIEPGFRAWLEDPDSFYAIPWFEVVARKP